MNPISFNLYNRDNQSCLYLESAPWPQNLFLEIENSSKQVLNLTRPSPDDEVGPNNYHFELLFRPGVLDGSLLDKITLSDIYLKEWQFKVVKKDQRSPVSLYFLKIGTEDLTLQPGQKIYLLMHNIIPANKGGTRGSKVMLRYLNISFPNSSERPTDSGEINLSLVNRRGGETSPLYAAFRGNNRIINDADISNELTLVLTNTQLYNSLPIAADSERIPSRFKISFEVQEGDENQHWALGTDGEVNGITITGEDNWIVQETGSDAGSAPLWEITTTKEELAPNEEINFSIENIKSSLPSGVAYLNLKIENIPGFRDSIFKIPIEKIPVVARGHRVGVGTDDPQAKLHVKSLSNVDGLKVDGNTAIAGQLSIKDGNVGIGTTNPVAKLEVRGGKSQLQQEEWQEPDELLNAWKNYHELFNSAGYFKDSLGTVHLKGRLVAGVDRRIFIIAKGYRPERVEAHGYENDGRYVLIRPDGVVQAWGYEKNTGLSLDGITYRAK